MGGRGSQSRARSGAAGDDPESFVGRPVLKDFFDDEKGCLRPFTGTVREYDPDEKWFLVVYEDDDKEELSLSEVRKLIARAERSGTSAAPAAAAEPSQEDEDDSEPEEASAEEPASEEEEEEEEEEDSENEKPPKTRVTRARTTPKAAAAPISTRTRLSPVSRAAAAAPAAKRTRAGTLPRAAPAKRLRQARYVDSDEEEYDSDSSEEMEEIVYADETETETESESESEEETEEEEEEEVVVEKARPSSAVENRAANAGASGSGNAKPAAAKAPTKAKAVAKKPASQAGGASKSKKSSTKEGKVNNYKRPVPKPKGKPPPEAALPPLASANVRVDQGEGAIVHGKEPWRAFGSQLAIPVFEEPDLSAAAVNLIKETKREYYKIYRDKTVEEKLRVEGAEKERQNKPKKTTKRPKKQAKVEAAAPVTQSQGEEEAAAAAAASTGGDDPADDSDNGGEKEKKLSQRPDRVTESYMKQNGLAILQEPRIGHIPGIPVSMRFYGRSEMSVLGLHNPPVAGIEFLGKAHTGLGLPIALSVVCAGWYEDDRDQGSELIYVGEGGNNLLGDRKQWAHQELKRGNEALMGNIRLGIPVRVTRKNKDPSSIYGCVLIYDGLYDVVEWFLEAGKQGFNVYKFRMVRRPNQGPLLSTSVQFKGVTAPPKLSALSRTGVVDTDISGKKERLPIYAVNETEDEELPPCTDLARVPAIEDLKGVDRGISEATLAKLRKDNYRPTVEYVTQYRYAPGIKRPSPPVVPAEFVGLPHTYLEKLNHGRLPYLDAKKGKSQLLQALPVVYECGPWAGCPLGEACPQAVTQRGIRYRLEVFKTDDGRGWGVRSLDMIPQHTFICDYYGDVFTTAQFERMLEEGGYDGEYSMDMAVRPDRDWQGNIYDDQRRTAHTAEYVVCGLKRRNVAAFINHSCAPNCFVQPVLSDHHDTRMPKISIFAAEDIAPFTQLTWDYGEDYAKQMGCKCGAVDCISTREPEDEAGPSGVVRSPLRSPAKLSPVPAVAAVLQRAGAVIEEEEEEIEEESDREGGSEPESESDDE